MMEKLKKELGKVSEELNHDRAIMFTVAHDVDSAKMLLAFSGNWEVFSTIFSKDTYINQTPESNIDFQKAKKMILNTALNICSENEDTLNAMVNKLTEIKDLNK